MTPLDFHRQHATIEPIKREIFTRRRHEVVLDYLLAVVIGTGLALALVSWWSS